MAALFDSPFNATDEISLASACAAHCRRRTRQAFYCIVAGILCLILGGTFRLTELILVPFALMLFFANFCFALIAFCHGTEYLLKFRRLKQGMFSVVSDMVFNTLCLLFMAAAFLIPSIHYGGPPMLLPAIDDAKKSGLLLSAYANDHNGKYPDNLETFIKTELPKTDLASPKGIKLLFYQKDGKQLRWILTPGLTTADHSNIILLQSAERIKADKREYLVVYTVGNSAEAIKNPEENIILINGKPALREK